jgi:hypothetical protein
VRRAILTIGLVAACMAARTAMAAPPEESGDGVDPRMYEGPTAVPGPEEVPEADTEPGADTKPEADTKLAPKDEHDSRDEPAAEAEPPLKSPPPAGTRTQPREPARPRNPRIPRIPVGQAYVQPWVRSTLFTEWYRNNHNTRQSDDGFASLVGRLGVGADTRLRRVTLGTQLRLDGQKIWFPDGQDCSGDCVPVDDDVRLERVTVRADTRYISVQAGDTNASFGRGMGLSVRKIDLIGVDATIKGGRVDVKTKPVRMTGVAGFANRQNSDFATRQLLEDPGYPAQSYTFSPRTEERGCNVAGALDPEIGNPLWTVCSDLVAGGRVEGTLPGKVDLGAHYVYLDFGEEATAGVVDEHAHLVGGDVGRMRIGGLWDVFVGASGIIRNPNLRGTPLEPQSFQGHGLYASNVIVAGTTTVLVEAKHYRRYLLAFTQTSLLQYAENPTLEREDQQVPGNQNASGGRVRVDHTWRDLGLTLFANTLEYVYADSLALDQFGPEGRLATHNFAGIIWRKPKTDFVLQMSGGYRHERYLDPPQDSALKRRFPHGEVYVSIPLARARGLTHALAVRAEGRWENYRTQGSGEDFFRGLLTLGYSMSPWFSVAFLQGIDTERPTPPGEPSLTSERCQEGVGSACRPHLWPGLQAQVNFFNASFLRVFVGRQYGGRICVNGSCRTLPDFEGVRTELVFSF